jgi:hypothetical protein
MAGLLGAITAVTLVVLALLADRAGPLEAHPPTVSVRPPPPMTMPTPPPITAPSSIAPPQKVNPEGSWLWIALAVIGGLLLVLAVVLLIRALRRPGRIAAPPLAAGSAALTPAVLGWLEEDQQPDGTDARTFDPRRAADEIIAAWEALESAAAASGHRRRPASTPTEFLESLTDWYHEAGGSPRGTDRPPRVPADGGDGPPDRAGFGGDGPPDRAGFGGDGSPDRAGYDGDGAQRGPGTAEAPARGGALSTADASAVLLRLYHRARFGTAALAPESAARARAAARVLGARLRPPDETPPGGPDDLPGGTDAAGGGPGGRDAADMPPHGPDAGPERGGRHR